MKVMLTPAGWTRSSPRISDAPKPCGDPSCPSRGESAGPSSFTKLEMLALSAIAYQQPVTRAELSRLVGHDISRDVLGRLKCIGVIARGRAPPSTPLIGRHKLAGYMIAERAFGDGLAEAPHKKKVSLSL